MFNCRNSCPSPPRCFASLFLPLLAFPFSDHAQPFAPLVVILRSSHALKSFPPPSILDSHRPLSEKTTLPTAMHGPTSLTTTREAEPTDGARMVSAVSRTTISDSASASLSGTARIPSSRRGCLVSPVTRVSDSCGVSPTLCSSAEGLYSLPPPLLMRG